MNRRAGAVCLALALVLLAVCLVVASGRARETAWVAALVLASCRFPSLTIPGLPGLPSLGFPSLSFEIPLPGFPDIGLSFPSLSLPGLPGLPSLGLPSLAIEIPLPGFPDIGLSFPTLSLPGLPGLPSLPSLPSISIELPLLEIPCPL